MNKTSKLLVIVLIPLLAALVFQFGFSESVEAVTAETQEVTEEETQDSQKPFSVYSDLNREQDEDSGFFPEDPDIPIRPPRPVPPIEPITADYEVDINYSWGATQSNYDEALEILRKYDSDLQVEKQEKYPPTHVVTLKEVNHFDFCSRVERQLEQKWYVRNVTCRETENVPEDVCKTDDDCSWKSVNCCSRNAGAQWECVNEEKVDIDCPKNPICPQVISPKPTSSCNCVDGKCTSEQKEKVDLTIRSMEGGTTMPEPGVHSYKPGKEVKIEAVPDENYEFENWEQPIGYAQRGRGSFERKCQEDDKVCTFTIQKDTEIVAHFSRTSKPVTEYDIEIEYSDKEINNILHRYFHDLTSSSWSDKQTFTATTDSSGLCSKLEPKLEDKTYIKEVICKEKENYFDTPIDLPEFDTGTGKIQACEWDTPHNCSDFADGEGECYQIETDQGLEILEYSDVGDLEKFVGKKVKWSGSRKEAGTVCSKSCPCDIVLDSIQAYPPENLDSKLYQLTLVDNPQEYATKKDIEMKDQKVNVTIEKADEAEFSTSCNLDIENESQSLISAWVPIENLVCVAEESQGVNRVRLPYQPHPDTSGN